MAAKMSENSDGGFTPVPDPTLLTTQQLIREIDSLRTQFLRNVDTVRDVIQTRLDAMDHAISLLQKQSDRSPTTAELAANLNATNALIEEKFQSVAIQFKERDTRTEQQARSTETAVNAALQAAKEAVGAQNIANAQSIAKSETSTTKQLDQIVTIIAALGKSIDDKINDLKDRQNATDTRTISVAASDTSRNKVQDTTNWGIVIAIGAALLVAVVGVALALRPH